ncbi:MAG: aminotransferase class IV, partial [Desulfovibrio sp.]|nr:aminotransferase class IV [Desulfovibrio sp.]
GSDNFLAFYDHRVGAICRDPKFLLIPLDDHICHRGDGLFESISYREGKIFALQLHMQRMQEGAMKLHIQPPCPWDIVQQICVEVARASGVQSGNLRVFLSRGPGGFGISPSECQTPGLYVVALREKLCDQARYLRGVTAYTSAIPPKQEYLVRIKNTNYLPNVFMAAEAEQRGYDVAVSFDGEGHMGEAATANIALILPEEGFVTPKPNQILEGTTLVSAREIMGLQMPIVQRDVTYADIYAAKEVLLLTSSSLCFGVTHFDDRALGQAEHCGKVGPLALWLKDELFAKLEREGIRF